MKVVLSLSFLKFEVNETSKGRFGRLVCLDDELNPIEIMSTSPDGIAYIESFAGKKKGDPIQVTVKLSASIKSFWV